MSKVIPFPDTRAQRESVQEQAGLWLARLSDGIHTADVSAYAGRMVRLVGGGIFRRRRLTLRFPHAGVRIYAFSFTTSCMEA